jgi:hypothetical protein
MTGSNHARNMGLIQGGLWLAISAGAAGVLIYPNFQTGGMVSARAASLYLVATALFAGIIAGFGAVNAARMDFLAGKIALDEQDRASGAALPAPAKPLWAKFLFGVIAQWLVLAGAGAAIFYLVFRAGVPLAGLLVVAGVIGGAHGGAVAWWSSRRELKKYVAHPPTAAEPFGGIYVWREHALGNGVINFLINPLVGYATFHVSAKHPAALVGWGEATLDMIVLCVMVGILVPIGATIQAQNDVKEGRIVPPRPARPAPGLVVRWLIQIAIGLTVGLTFAAASRLLAADGLALSTVMVLKGVISGALGAAAGMLAAWWSAAATATEKN